MDSVRVYVAGDGPSTGRVEGFRISRAPTGQTNIDPISGPLVKTSYGLDDIDPALLNAAYVYAYRAGEVGPRKFVATVLVLKLGRTALGPGA